MYFSTNLVLLLFRKIDKILFTHDLKVSLNTLKNQQSCTFPQNKLLKLSKNVKLKM